MAYDLWTKKVTSSNWARGDEPEVWGNSSVVGNWLGDKITALATSSIPWKPIVIVAGVLAGFLVFPGFLRGKREAKW